MPIAHSHRPWERTSQPLITSLRWLVIASVSVSLSIGLGGCGHPPAPESDAPPAVIAAPTASSDGPYGPGHRREAIARAATAAQQERSGGVDIDHPSAHFSTTTLPGSDAGAVACWTVIFPSRLAAAAAPGDALAPDATAQPMPAAASGASGPPRLPRTGMAAMSGAGITPPSAGDSSAAPGMPSTGMTPSSGHALGDGGSGSAGGTTPERVPMPGTGSPPALFAAGGAAPPPNLLPVATSASAAPNQPSPAGVGMMDTRTAYAPPPLVVFVMEDGRTLVSKPRY